VAVYDVAGQTCLEKCVIYGHYRRAGYAEDHGDLFVPQKADQTIRCGLTVGRADRGEFSGWYTHLIYPYR
jgi:hypothetical protein